MSLTVGIVGTGRMGSAMARSLARAGHGLVVWNRSADKAATLAAATGARVAATPREVAAASEVLITMLADDAAVRAVYTGPDGVLAGLSARTIAAEMSTVLPDVVRDLDGPIRATGARIVDAPVSGSVSGAESGGLTIMVGGEPADVERARPAFDSLATRVIHMGPLGTGATMKLAVNDVIFGLNQAVSEALVLAEGAGIDRALAYEVFAGSAIAAPFVLYKRAAFEQPETAPVAFALDLAVKDVRLILGVAARLGVRMPQAQVNLAMLLEAAAGGRGNRDLAAVATLLRETPATDQPTDRGAQR